jgi:hypothetical protein
MTLIINDTTMASDYIAHTARHSPDRIGREVSWLPGQLLGRNTAMTLTDAATGHEPHDRHRPRPDADVP